MANRRQARSPRGKGLYLSRIKIKNVRCFENISIDLESPSGDPRMWGVVLGDNGVGKTSLLRCIAMGLCDSSGVAGLLSEVYGDWIRVVDGKRKQAEIELEFYARGRQKRWRIATYIIPVGDSYWRIEQDTFLGGSKRTFPWDALFAYGYGAARRAFGTRDIEEYATVDAVYTLFNYDTALQNPELVLRRIFTDRVMRYARGKSQLRGLERQTLEPLLDSISKVLLLPNGSVQLRSKGIAIDGPWGEFQPLGALGDGYQATLACIADLLGWAFFYDHKLSLGGVVGIVLIDELEQHLHPLWQRKIIKVLREQFPRVQFIATTHTPMCAIGTSELRDDECELIVLERGEEDSVHPVEFAAPRDLWADQVLTSRLFKLPTTGGNRLVEAIRRYYQLETKLERGDRLTPREKKETAALSKYLNQHLNTSESKFEERIRAEVLKAMRRESKKIMGKAAVNYEIRRQLREIAND